MLNSQFKMLLILVITSLWVITQPAYSQEASVDTVIKEESTNKPLDENAIKRNELEELSLLIKEKNQQLRALRVNAKKTREPSELQLEIQNTSHQVDTLNKSFEQLVIGGINPDLFGVEKTTKTWQEELALVVKPLLENLRGLTERPRRKENLRQLVALQKATVAQSEKAITAVNQQLTLKPSKQQTQLLESVKSRWQRINEEAEQQRQLAVYQLDSLNSQGDHWFTSIKDSLLNFFRERGLTLLLALIVSATIWLLLAGLRKMFDRRGRSSNKHVNRTAYRVVAYAQKLLMVILIIIGVLTVFFIRGDVLLLVITLALLFASALGLKTLLPQFIAESRLLLNIGAVREHEQVIIDGIPWRVASINVFSKFSNPEIQGILRLPLAALKELNSRPINEEKWFPSSIGDWVLDSDRNLYEVIRQSPFTVELQSAQGTNKLLPTQDYFSAGFVNLTKSKQIRITNRFGVGYELQDIALTEVPETFQSFVQTHLESANLDTTQITVRVELEQAAASSLDYIIIALLGSKASKYFYRIERTIQQACVDACNTKGWGIPYPQLTVHHNPTPTQNVNSKLVTNTK